MLHMLEEYTGQSGRETCEGFVRAFAGESERNMLRNGCPEPQRKG